VCLTFNLRGHAETEPQHETVTREDNLRDLAAAYDLLASQPLIDKASIAVVGSSYGAYLAAILTSLRTVRWLALRVPALYKDEDWALPKQQLKKYGLDAFRRRSVSPDENRALRACATFEGDVLVVESECDDIIPHPVIANYMAAFEKAHSLTYRVIEGLTTASLRSPGSRRSRRCWSTGQPRWCLARAKAPKLLRPSRLRARLPERWPARKVEAVGTGTWRNPTLSSQSPWTRPASG
jgi:hypothetical protein